MASIVECGTHSAQELRRTQLSSIQVPSWTSRKTLIYDDAAEALAAFEDMKSAVRLIDAVQDVRNVSVDWQLAGEVLVNELRDIGTSLPAPEGCANPAASCDQLEGTRCNFLARSGNAYNTGAPPAPVSTLESSTHDFNVASAILRAIKLCPAEREDRRSDCGLRRCNRRPILS